MSDELKDEGLSFFRRGMHDEALTRFEAAASSYDEAGDAINHGEMLNNIGVVQRVRQNWEVAEEAFNRAVEVFTAAGDDNRRGQTLGNLGDLYAFKGEADLAAHYYSEGAELLARTEDREKQAQLLRALSLLRLRQRRIIEALALMEQSLETRPAVNLFQRLFLLMIRLLRKVAGG